MTALMTLTDEELLRLLEEVESREARAREAVAAAADAAELAGEDAPADRAGDPCPACGEPAVGLAACHACGLDGCLPRDDWMPGMEDPCLTRCARCGLHVHVTCASMNEAGNPVCCGPRAEDDYVPPA